MTREITLTGGPADGNRYLIPDGTKHIALPDGTKYTVKGKTATHDDTTTNRTKPHTTKTTTTDTPTTPKG